jgi:hypothetical protein
MAEMEINPVSACHFMPTTVKDNPYNSKTESPPSRSNPAGE